jgi:hypothetical protein
MIEEAEFLIHPSRIAGRIRPSSSLGEPMLPEAIDVAMVNIKHWIPRRLVGIAHPASVADIIVDYIVRAGLELPMLRAEMDEP